MICGTPFWAEMSRKLIAMSVIFVASGNVSTSGSLTYLEAFGA